MTFRRWSGWLCAALSLACLSCGQEAKTPPVSDGYLKGVVLDAKKNVPVPGAAVRVGEAVETTSAEGAFMFTVPPGDYALTVSRDKYETFQSPSKVTVQAGRVASYDVLLQPKALAPFRVKFGKTPAALSRERNAEFSWAAETKEAGRQFVFAFFLEGLDQDFGPPGASKSRIYTDLKDGRYVFRVKAKDEENNVESDAAEHPFEVDATPPLNPSVIPASAEKFTGSRALDLVLSAEGATEAAVWESPEPTALPWSPFRDRRQFALSQEDGPKIVFARFRDRAGNESDTVSCDIVLDREPPTVPEGLRAEVQDSGEVRLSWNPSKDAGAGMEGYSVLRDGIEIGKSKTTTFADRQARLGQSYTYSVAAVDRMKRSSDPGPGVTATLKGRPPEVPSTPRPTDGAGSQPTGLTLTWKGGDPDQDDAVTYDLSFGTAPQPPQFASGLTSPAFPLTELEPSKKYYWQVIAKDKQGLQAKGPVWSFSTAAKRNTTPIPVLSATPLSGPATKPFRFDASRSRDAEDPDSTLVFQWDFDNDGKPDTEWAAENTATRQFPEIGEHTVTVFVKDTQGATAQASIAVESQNSPPVLEGDPMPANGATGEPLDVKFAWRFTDPDQGDKLLFDFYFGKGETTLRAMVRGTAEKTAALPEPLEPGAVYYWRVEARDSRGAVTRGPLWSFVTAKKSVQLPFHAEVTAHPKVGKTTTPFRFDASGSSDPTDPPEALRVRWDWNGDDAFDTDWSTDKQAVRTFDTIGTIKVGLEAQNTRGETAKALVNITVQNTAPIFLGKPSPENGASNLESDVSLSWKISDPDPEDPVTFTVFFGPAAAGGPVETASKRKESSWKPPAILPAGVYNWKIVAQDSHGGKAETPIYTFMVKKRENLPPLKPQAIESPEAVRIGDNAVFRSKSRDPERDALKLRFDWGDGNVSPWMATQPDGSAELTHLFAKEGAYVIKAQAIDTNENTSPWSDPLKVQVLPALKPGDLADLWHWDPAEIKGLPDLVTVKIRYWFASLGGSGEWQGVGDPRGNLDIVSDLGITERRGAPWIRADIGKYISGGVDYFMLECYGSALLGSDSAFGGITYPAGTNVETSSRTHFGQLFACFNPYLGDYFGGGFKLGLAYFWNQTTVRATGDEPHWQTIEFPMPFIGIQLYGVATKYFRVNFEASFIEGGIQEFKLRFGRLLEIAGDVTFMPVPYVGIALGWRYTGILANIKTGTGLLDTRVNTVMDGVSLSLVAHF